MHYYQFNIGDYQSHTSHLTEMEDLAYRRLLDWYYLHETSIPDDIPKISRQIRMRSHSECITTVLKEFFVLTDSGWISNRADKEIAKTGEKSAKARESANARWKKDANALQTQSECNATHNTLPITQDTLHKLNTIQVGNKFPPCPSQQILELWKKHLPHLTQPRTWEGSRQSNLKNRWIQASKHSDYSDGYTNLEEGIQWWDSFFEYIAKDTKLANGFESKDRTWKPDLEWVVNASNFQKIIDGKYNK